jgi:molybdopterin-guanine dinucleotide biosynthesis protein A
VDFAYGAIAASKYQADLVSRFSKSLFTGNDFLPITLFFQANFDIFHLARVVHTFRLPSGKDYFQGCHGSRFYEKSQIIRINSMTMYPITGVILAGGQSRRMGRSKAFLEIGGVSLLQRVTNHVAAVCREVILVTRDPVELADMNHRIVKDLVPGQGPLGGVATGLFYARFPWCLITACDLPFLKQAFLERLASLTKDVPRGPRALVPQTPDGWQPLVAVYHRDCQKPAQRLLSQGERKLDDLRDHGVIWQSIPADDFRDVDPNLETFINVNTPDELELARTKIEQRET